jgi:uncharacterized protein with HEPN domain
MSRNDRLRILDILDAIEKVFEYAAGQTYEAFLGDMKTQDAVARNIEIIGEASRLVSKSFKAAHPQIPWRDMVDMRNTLIHVYFGILPDIVWGVMHKELPELKSLLMDVVKSLDNV